MDYTPTFESLEGETRRPRRDVPPSRVVHVRGLPEGTTEADLAILLQPFGAVNFFRVMPRLHQALVEFQLIESASACVDYSRTQPFALGGRPISIAFSTSSEIHRPKREREEDKAGTPAHVLLFTIHNPLYPISADVLHTITSPHGTVRRIAVTRKNGIQAFVEMDSVDAAAKALAALHGQDIYAGSCTLDVQYSRAERVTVRSNGEDSRDYTPQGLTLPRSSGQDQALLTAPGLYGMSSAPAAAAVAPAASGYAQSASMGSSMGASMGSMGSMGMGANMGMGSASMGMGMSTPMGMGMSMGGGVAGGSAVVMLHGMSPVLNCTRLFNLVSVFGNISKVKFLAKKPGAALVQFVDAESAAFCVSAINGFTLFNSVIDAKFSKFQYISDADSSDRLPDGTPCTVDFSASLLNRFKGPMSTQMEKVLKPTSGLHFYNAPLGTNEDIIKQLLDSRGASRPARISFFLRDGKEREKGLLFYENSRDACEAMVLCNNAELKTQDGHIYTLKFAFSAKTSQ